MSVSTSEPEAEGVQGRDVASRYVRWGGLAALVGPLLVLVANIYGIYVSRTYGAGADGLVAAATTTPYVVFGGVRLLGAILLVFGLIALYAFQLEAADRLGLLGFIGGMVGSVLLLAVAWFQTFTVPVLAAEVPAFLAGVRSGETGVLLGIGIQAPIFIQAIGWTIFGIASYRASVFPRSASVALIVGALLLFVPVQGIPVVFQLAIAWLGFLVFTGRLDAADQEPSPADTTSTG